MRVFLSHNHADKKLARSLGAYLVLAGVDVWFDDWEIQAGDSIPGKLNEGLEGFDIFILVWSANAVRSSWVRKEFEAALHRVIGTNQGRIVPCLLDDTPLPPLLSPIRGVNFKQQRQAMQEVVDGVRGFRTRKERMMAIQDALHEIVNSWFVGQTIGPYICCPSCGSEGTLEGSEAWGRWDDHYEIVRCKECGWEDGGEI